MYGLQTDYPYATQYYYVVNSLLLIKHKKGTLVRNIFLLLSMCIELYDVHRSSWKVAVKTIQRKFQLKCLQHFFLQNFTIKFHQNLSCDSEVVSSPEKPSGTQIKWDTSAAGQC
jgi:hypothetical protein